MEASVRETSSQLAQTNELVTATTSRINTLNNEIGNANSHLSSTQQSLHNAEGRLERRKREQRAVRIGVRAIPPHRCLEIYTQVEPSHTRPWRRSSLRRSSPSALQPSTSARCKTRSTTSGAPYATPRTSSPPSASS